MKHFAQLNCSLSFCPLLFCQIDHFAQLFYEGTEYSKTCFGRFWIIFQINFASILHLCLRKAGKTLPELTFSRGYRALKNTFWQVLSHISEINFTTIFHLCLRNGGKTLPELTFSRGYREPKSTFWSVWSYIFEKFDRINSPFFWVWEIARKKIFFISERGKGNSKEMSHLSKKLMRRIRHQKFSRQKWRCVKKF